MAKYDSYIELTPGYESVINLGSKKDDNDFWKHYIVNDDMVKAIRMISKSLKPDDVKNDVWHFWIQGSYGTGKSYSALVLQHLLQDEYSVVENFMTKNRLFADVKDKFLNIRKKGKFYVTFRDGECDSLNTASKFLFEIERSVRSVLSDNDFQYTGKNSLIDSVVEKTTEFKATLKVKFDSGDYPEYWATYDEFDDFYNDVQIRNVTACNIAQEILGNMNVGLASSNIDTFKSWLRDVFDGNKDLKKTGIFIIWDEFTDYIRHNDLNIIEQLSKFSQEDVPLYIIYVIHKYPGLETENGQAQLSHADARFHKIQINLSENTTLKLIGESIIAKDGMKDSWAEECDILYSSIAGSIHSFMPDPSVEMNASDWKKIFPMHPMSVNLVSRIAGDAASNRSIFKFMKSDEADGFKAYIKNNGPDDWKWVTPDYLWDYYFVNGSGGVKDLSQNAKDALSHYNKVQHLISDDNALRVFKVAMLLLATVGSSRTMRRTRGSRGIQATEKTLFDCFCGQLTKDVVSEYLTVLGPGKNSDGINVLTLAPEEGDRRIELPYSGGSDELQAEVEKLKQASSLTKLFESKGPFGAVLKKQFAPDEKPVVKRLEIFTCWGTTQQIHFRMNELQSAIEKTYHKFGILLIALPDLKEIEKVKTELKSEIDKDTTGRVMGCILRQPLSSALADQWYSNCANANLAHRSGNSVNSKNYSNEADLLCSTWVGTALGKDMLFVSKDGISTAYSNKNIIANYEKIVFKLFPYATERFIKKSTVYKSATVTSAALAVLRADHKDKSHPVLKNYNAQWEDIVEELRNSSGNVFDCSTAEEAIHMSGTLAANSVAKLVSYLDTQMASGTVFLTDLWSGLQQELGYYSNMICCYLLGFAFKYYIGKFTWFDGNNSHKLDEKTIPTMVVEMCNGKKVGMKLSSESDVEKRFKKISAKIFGLSDKEIGDVYECRKSIKIKILKTGYPVWALKYLDDSVYAGVKNRVIDIIDKYNAFVLEIGNQNDVMEETVAIFKENAKVYQRLLAHLLADKSLYLAGITNFIFAKSEKAKEVCDTYQFNFATLFGMLKKSMEAEIWQWKEEAVCERIDKLILDLELVGVVNKAINGSAESVERVRANMENMLSLIRVPGCVYAKLDYEWIDALLAMRDISVNKWVGYSLDEKRKVIEVLKQHMETAVENLNNPLDALKKYIIKMRLGTFSNDEVETLLKRIHKESYDQTESNFKEKLKKEIDELAYSTKVNMLKNIWKASTGTNSVKEWSAKWSMPVIWAMPDFSMHFGTLLSLERHERVDVVCLDNAISALSGANLDVLSNKATLDTRFVENVSSDKNKELILPHIDALKCYVAKTYPYPSSWSPNIVKVRLLVEQFVREKLKAEVGDKAKSKVSGYSEQKLRETLEKILDNCIDACSIVLDE